MTTYKLQARVNGGAWTEGGITVAAGDVVELRPDSTVGITSYRYEIYHYPTGFACPAGWSADSSGVYYSTAASPAAITVGADWSKYGLRFTANGGKSEVKVGTTTQLVSDPNLVDEGTALSVPSTTAGLVGMMPRETTQFGPDWVASYNADMQKVEALVAASSTTGALFAALRTAVTASPAGTKLFLKGYSTPGDGGEGTFTVLSGGSYTDDGGTIACAGGLGATEAKCAKRDLSGARRDPRHFGAVCDGTTDDSAAYMLAVNSFGTAGGGKVLVPKGVSRVKLDLDGTLGTNLGSITFVGESRARPGFVTGSVLKAITKAQNGGVSEPGFVVRAAGQNIHFEDVGFDGDKRAPIVFHFDYQSFGSGLHRCFVTRAQQNAPITLTPDHTTDKFTATGHGLVNGDQIIIRTTATLPDTIYQAVSGTYAWVWHVVNATLNDFQVERYVGEGAWTFGTNGTGTITAEKYGGTLVQIGGLSGLQADTGTIRDCVLIQDVTDFTQLCGRGLFISDANAVRWDVSQTHIQNAVDNVYVRGGGASFREVTNFPVVGVSRSHYVKDGKTSTVVISDGTYTEVDACAILVCLNPDAADFHAPWVFEHQFPNVGRGNIDWDCKQPLYLSGPLGGDINITATGGQMVTAIGTAMPLTGDTTPQFHGALERLVKVAHSDRGGDITTEIKRLTAPSADPGAAGGRNGYGLFLGGGNSNNDTIRKAGPVVVDHGISQSAGTGGNSTAQAIHAKRDAAAITIESVDTAADKFKITGHALTVNDSVRLTTTSALPAGFVTGNDYWVVPIDADWFSLAHDHNGEVIPVSDVGTGTHKATPLRSFVALTFDASNISGYSNATRIDSVGPVYVSAPSAKLEVGTLSLGTSYLKQFSDTLETFGSITFSATDGIAHAEAIYTPAANTVFGVTYCVEAEKADHTTAIVVLAAAFKVVAGVVTQIGTTHMTQNDRDAGAAAWSLGLDTDGAAVRLTYTLENGVDVRCQGEVRRRV